jgi:hypothetical protein
MPKAIMNIIHSTKNLSLYMRKCTSNSVQQQSMVVQQLLLFRNYIHWTRLFSDNNENTWREISRKKYNTRSLL